jgi:predicted AAA+ superfamily ATPase
VDYLPRIVDAQISRLMAGTPIVMLEGARATGKTTTAARLASSEIRLPRDLALLQSDPTGVLARLERPVLIDEWQLAGIDVLWVLKEIVDADPTPGSFILTGSVEPESYGPTYPLTGRAARVVMRPMTVRETDGRGAVASWLDGLLSDDLLRAAAGGGEVDVALMTRSGFPGADRAVDATPWLLAYADAVSQREGDERHDPVRVRRLLRVLAELEGTIVPDERLWSAADINRLTFLRYEAMLARAHVTQPSTAWQTNRLKRLTGMPKRYLGDCALALALAGIDADQLRLDPALAGRYLDSFAAAQLRPEVDLLHGTLHHLRTRAGQREVDLVVEIAGKVTAIEIKSGVNPTRDDARHLVWLKGELGDRLVAAVVLHRGGDTRELAPGIWALPLSTLWS